MVPILTVIILVITALFGAVMFARLRHPHKESDPFECGMQPFSIDEKENQTNVTILIVFLCVEALIIMLILMNNIVS